MLSLVSLKFSSIACCSAVTKSASAVAICNAYVGNHRSRGLDGSFPRKTVFGQHPIDK